MSERVCRLLGGCFFLTFRNMIATYVFGRGNSKFLLEADAEILRIVKSDLVCNFGDRDFFRLDYLACFFQSDIADEIGRRHASKHLDFSVQGRFGYIHVVEKHVK